MQQAIHENERRDGVRMSWNIWPPTRMANQRVILPVGCMYTPLKKSEELKLVSYQPVQCKCQAVLNPWNYIDFRTKTWHCNFCGARNPLPPTYAEHITETVLPEEKKNTTIEYILPNQSCAAPVILFVLDTCLNNPEDEPELEKAKEAIQQALQTMPPDTLVGFITFGNLVSVYEIGFQELSKSYAFRGTKKYTREQVARQLGIPPTNDPRAGSQAGYGRFLVPIRDCEFALNAILDDLQKDRWPSSTERRGARSTGCALNVAISLLETCHMNQSARIVLLTSGPCTIGPGNIVTQDKADMLRSNQDIQKDRPNAQLSKPALKFYSELMSRAVTAGHAVDIFASSLDQTGCYEMRVMCERTGGVLVMADGYSMNVFRDSFQKLYSSVDENNFLQMGFNARIQTFCSKEFKVSGAIGPCASINRKGPMVGETEVGECGTTEWRMGALDPNTTLAFYFEIATDGAAQNNSQQMQQQQAAHLQFHTLYNHPSGQRRLRVTTLMRQFADPQLGNISQGFDQEAAVCLLTRTSMYQLDSLESNDIMRRIERMLIRFCSKFASYNKDAPDSFQMHEEMQLFPQFVFYLCRRSPFLNLFGFSPDEASYYRCNLLRENVLHTMVMIQPALFEYTLSNPTPAAVLLDSRSLKNDVILMMDTFFHVLIWRGNTIQQWYDQGYHEKEEFAHLKELLMAPAKDAKDILGDRFPTPKFIQTTENGSQARFLMARVNPAVTHSSTDDGGMGAPVASSASLVRTEDASLAVFLNALIKLAVASSG